MRRRTMKKKILLFVAVLAMLVCLLAISVSAAEPDTTKETVTLSDGKVCPLWDTDGDALIWYISATNEETKVNTYSYVKATSSEVDYNCSWNGTTHGATCYQVGTITITVDGTAYAASKIVVANFMDDILVTSNKCIDSRINAFSGTFKSSTNIQYVYLPLDTVALHADVFNGCSNLVGLNLEDLLELRMLNTTTLSGCKKLYSGQVLDLTNTKLVEIAKGALSSVPVTEIKLPSTLKTIGEWAFQYTAITRMDLPESITSFNDNSTFRGCESLETITGYKRLIDNKIVKQIGSNQFEKCYALSNVDGLITNGVLVIPEGFTRINGQLSFSDCDRLVYVEFPSTITYVGQAAFSWCDNIKLVSFDKVDAKIKNAIKNGESYTSVEFNNCGTFKGCKNLVALSVPEGTTTIINRFVGQGCTSLTAFYMPNSVKEIGTNGGGQGAFCSATKMYFVAEPFTVGQCLVDGQIDLTKLELP